MDTAYIISKMNEFMFRLSERMGKWLNKRLPKITENWWDELVLSNLSMLQREKVLSSNIHELRGLDLASLLRVFDRNWFVITSTFFVNNRERGNIRKMQEVRNAWAHITPQDITKKRVIEDTETIIALMQAMDASSRETRDMEAFIFDIEEDKEIKAEPEKKKETSHQSVESQNGGIQIGSPVALVSDKSIIGAVIGKDGNRYTVLVNGKFENFYEEQIELIAEKRKKPHVSLQRVRTALTAYQISNPGSSNLYSLNSARIDFVPYQFRPALKMISSDNPRLLVADDVGVGKTIEAGLILKELEARSSINSVLIICPRPLVAERKWVLEMKRFDENFTQLDGRALTEAILETNRDGVWPDRHNKTIIPYSLFGEDMVQSLRIIGEEPLHAFAVVEALHDLRDVHTGLHIHVDESLVRIVIAAGVLLFEPVDHVLDRRTGREDER